MNTFLLIPPFFFLMISAIPAADTGGDHHHAIHDHSAHSHAETRGTTGPFLHSLEVSIHPQFEGTVEVEQRFRLEIDGDRIKHGPVLQFLTVFRSTGGLVLDSGMEIETVTRDGKDEPFRLEYQNGMSSLFIGTQDLILEPGAHDYLVRYRHLGTWKKSGNILEASFDVTEAFRNFRIDRAKVNLVLPKGVEFLKRTVSIARTTAAGPGFTKELTPDHILIETTSPLQPNHFFLLNAEWPSTEFSSRSQWKQMVLQHPRIPLSLTAGVTLLLSLQLLIRRQMRQKRKRITTFDQLP